jgi:predicted Fe-Mo cluster-binding NifX family protein
MRVAVSAGNSEIESPIQPRFGRCAYFVIVDTETRAWEALPNPAVEAIGGAGPQAAQFLADQNVQAVISGNYGPNAFLGLEAAGIRILRASEGSVSELVDAFLDDRLEAVAGPTGPSRHGG